MPCAVIPGYSGEMASPHSLKICFVGNCRDFCHALFSSLAGENGEAKKSFFGSLFYFEDDVVILGLWDLSDSLKKVRNICYLDSDLLLICVDQKAEGDRIREVSIFLTTLNFSG